MRKKKLRGVAVVLSCGLTMGMLGGCGIAGEGEAENTKNNEDKTVIEYWHINSETVGGKTVDELVKEFNESNDEIEVVARYNPEEYKGLMQNLQAETAAGNAPAVVQIGWTYLNYFSSNFDYVSPQNIIDEFFPGR